MGEARIRRRLDDRFNTNVRPPNRHDRRARAKQGPRETQHVTEMTILPAEAILALLMPGRPLTREEGLGLHALGDVLSGGKESRSDRRRPSSGSRAKRCARRQQHRQGPLQMPGQARRAIGEIKNGPAGCEHDDHGEAM